MKKHLIFLLLLFFVSCTLFKPSIKYVRKLEPDIKAWYEVHQVLMNTKPPDWIIDTKMTEQKLFLLLPAKYQRLYIREVFWEIRHEGLEEEFYSRIITANKFFSHTGKVGWRTDRGQMMVRCGFPTSIYDITVGDLVDMDRLLPGMHVPPSSIEGAVYQVWHYIFKSRLIVVIFQWDGFDFKLAMDSTISVASISELERHNRNVFAPIWERLEPFLLLHKEDIEEAIKKRMK